MRYLIGISAFLQNIFNHFRYFFCFIEATGKVARIYSLTKNIKMKQLKIQNHKIQQLSREAQRNILGGKDFVTCSPGCYSLFFQESDSNRCAVASFDNSHCFGVVQNGLCCIF